MSCPCPWTDTYICPIYDAFSTRNRPPATRCHCVSLRAVDHQILAQWLPPPSLKLVWLQAAPTAVQAVPHVCSPWQQPQQIMCQPIAVGGWKLGFWMIHGSSVILAETGRMKAHSSPSVNNQQNGVKAAAWINAKITKVWSAFTNESAMTYDLWTEYWFVSFRQKSII